MSTISIPPSTFIERAAENLGEDIGRLQRGVAFVADRVSEDTRVLAKRARYGLRNGAERAVVIQDKLVADVRKRPVPYALIVVALAAVIGLKLVLGRRPAD
ncbi:MAG TPA: hypothetical protein VIT21_00295 [Chthoniobacterales bacterium]